ncbi:hypothetical protein BO70DRAFT_368545 [Aspergillus heteromorphus CBS 117.55]|uniref:Rhodopsin domain-containing protein n=1 Tax=Aspergillus heteromorphus CBS 117.55 TaxID=1448321 RepID=A0A317WVQ0_9EURO|nr:uncharacterized protein BO70DRAFT_368545 [Aspergillus heteromorphus CBS 117.55]PWY89911.1 hypothetical protein BO70DRAFT_368545 [Aspergillus heteromorphus CBS 117.55]
MWVNIDTRDEASKVAYDSTVQLFTLYSVACAVTVLRTYSQCRDMGWRRLRLDDYLIWLAIIFYTAQIALAYSVGKAADGLANNSMTEAQRIALAPNSAEYRASDNRLIGSKIQVAGWATYTALINSLKLSMLAFYLRLMDGVSRHYRIPIWVGFGLVIGCFLTSLITILAACRPFQKNWQINPDPGNVCQPAISKPVIAATFAANLVTDPYLVLIPIPMLWKSSLKLLKKIAATVVLSAGIFVLVCATLKSVFLLVDPGNGASIADEWGTRETFVAVITTNLPIVFHLFRTWLARIFGGAFKSSQKTYKSPSGEIHTVGGGSGGDLGRNRRRKGSVDRITVGLTFTESEERMMADVEMQTLKPYEASVPGTNPRSAIVVSNQIEITHEASSIHPSESSAQGGVESW